MGEAKGMNAVVGGSGFPAAQLTLVVGSLPLSINLPIMRP